MRTPAGVEENYFLGLPPKLEWSYDLLDEPTVLWGDKEGELFFVAYGSGNCPRLVMSIDWTAADRVVLRTDERHPILPLCTGDLSPTTSVIDLGSNYQGGPLTVVVEFDDFPDISHTSELPSYT